MSSRPTLSLVGALERIGVLRPGAGTELEADTSSLSYRVAELDEFAGFVGVGDVWLASSFALPAVNTKWGLQVTGGPRGTLVRRMTSPSHELVVTRSDLPEGIAQSWVKQSDILVIPLGRDALNPPRAEVGRFVGPINSYQVTAASPGWQTCDFYAPPDVSLYLLGGTNDGFFASFELVEF